MSSGWPATRAVSDALFKKPWRLSKKAELMAGVGPEWIHTDERGRTTNALGRTVANALESKLAYPWACSSAGRAPALQAGGRGFESPHVHQAFF